MVFLMHVLQIDVEGHVGCRNIKSRGHALPLEIRWPLGPACHRFAQDNGKQIMDMYCDQDILILMVNAPFVVRFVLAFATTFMAKRQPLAYCRDR